MIPLAAPQFYTHFPAWAQILLKSGITAGSIVAVIFKCKCLMVLVIKLLTNLIVRLVKYRHFTRFKGLSLKHFYPIRYS